jgi:hypothetical protein
MAYQSDVRTRWRLVLGVGVAIIATTAALALGRAQPAQAVETGAATAFCSYNSVSWQLTYHGNATGWKRGNLSWDLDVMDPVTGQKLGALHHAGVFRNATSGSTTSYTVPLSMGAWRVQMRVEGPGGSELGYCVV